MSKFVCDFSRAKVEKTLIFYTHPHAHTAKYCQAEEIAKGDFNRIGRKDDSDD